MPKGITTRGKARLRIHAQRVPEYDWRTDIALHRQDLSGDAEVLIIWQWTQWIVIVDVVMVQRTGQSLTEGSLAISSAVKR